ncbi:phospholipase D-like domain-containing protein [Haloarcula sp. CGMCC 1.2071]|uniref:phospholipase D-like domain-containing protein n=1 Tax=Haloarcula sp. CGMCC 1.2071 TaxID=3111454 RepID=UPI00300F13CC
MTEATETRVWGVSPESLLLGVLARQRSGTADSQALRRYYDIEILRTNYDPGWESFQEGIDQLCAAWFPPEVAYAARTVPQESVSAFVAGAAYYDTPSGIANLLVHGQEVIKTAEKGEAVTMSQRDVYGYVDTTTERELAQSLRIITPVPDGYKLNRAVFEPLVEGVAKPRSEAAYETVHQVLSHLGVDRPEAIVAPLLETFDIEPPPSPPTETNGALSVYVRNKVIQDVVEALFGAELEAVVSDLASQTERERTQLQETLALGTALDETADSIKWPFEPATNGVCALASQRRIPLAAGWLAEQAEQSELGVYNDLKQAGIETTYEDGLIRFEKAYPVPEDTCPSVNEYNCWVQNELAVLQDRLTALRILQSSVSGGSERQERRILTTALSFMESFTISPTRFIYTIFDPEFHADAYSIDNYVGDSRELEREVKMIRRWRKERPGDAESFAKMIREVINHPLEVDNVDSVVRIMCPWTNFAIQDYVSQLSRLFDNGIDVRLLFRLPQRDDWGKLKRNLLSRLGDTRGHLELRSYTRYKEYHDHTELREMRADDGTYLHETGVHAKLFVAGSSRNGNLLAGSANLMENSLYYNPEAGLQTRNPNVIETAVDYFDLVWELAAPDRIPEEAYTGETEYTFFPSVYRPQ